jgi:tRNA dimethylallyltransferase
MMPRKLPVLFIVGPTATGKSEVAIKLAKKLDAEIISGDSMQVYKRLPILTWQPSAKNLNRVPHHLVGVLEPTSEWNAAEFARRGKKEITDIHRRGRLPLIVGGSGLYVRALLDGIFSGPGKNELIRERLYKQAEKSGSERLYARLKRIDPRTAAAVHPHDLRRIIRALEVYELSGRPISELKERTRGIASKYKTLIFGLSFPRSLLYRRIEERVEAMFRKGAVAEVKKLCCLPLSQTAALALGIKEIKEYLNGSCSLPEAKEELKKNTRRFAKRQFTWFRKDKRICWIRCSGAETTQEIAKRILKHLTVTGL